MTFSSERRRARDPVREDPVRRESRIGGDELALVYAEHSRSLLKLAALLVPDIVAAREVVYESFAALNRELRYRDQTYAENRLRSREEVLAFLLRNVVYRARAAMTGGVTSAAHGQAAGDAAVIRAVRALPDDQREALVLRYYG
ncbi:MAG: hypothetical protein ACRDN0_38240, partial [Trebonia sp.]